MRKERTVHKTTACMTVQITWTSSQCKEVGRLANAQATACLLLCRVA